MIVFMKVTESKAEQILGAVFAVLGVVLIAVVIPWQIKDVPYDIIFNSPRFFPSLISALLAILGVVMFIQGWRKRGKEDQEAYVLEKREAILVALTLGVMAAYTALLYILPYIPVTIAAMALLIWAYGQKSWKKLAIAAIVLPVIIYVMFRFGLSLKMP